MDIILSLTGLSGFAAAVGVTLMAGFVKGAVGFAMPLIMLSGMSLFLEPTLVLAAMIFPVVASNLLQTVRGGLDEARAAISEHWRYLLIVIIMIAVAAQFVTAISDQVMYLILGIPVTLLSLVQLSGLKLQVPPQHRRVTEWIVGLLAGGLGGLSGIWGPPTVLYLMALNTPKARQIAAQGVVYGLGSVTLLAAHLNSGILNGQTIPFSALLLIPALVGMQLGFWTSDRLNPDVFRKVTLAVLVVSGLNLIRRGLLGV